MAGQVKLQTHLPQIQSDANPPSDQKVFEAELGQLALMMLIADWTKKAKQGHQQGG